MTDIIRLGQHRLVCGDATELKPYQMLLGNELAQMTLTDPPYNVAYQRGDIIGDDQGESFGYFLKMANIRIVDHTAGSVYIFMSSSEMYNLKNAFEAAGGRWSTFIIWAKNHFSIGRSHYHRQFEPLLYGWTKGRQPYWCEDRSQSDLWFHPRVARNKLHPTMKPIGLLERAIKNSSQEGGIVLDPFGGSGSTLIACENVNRKCRMIEIDPHYIDVIVDRWEKHTGQRAQVIKG